MRASLKSSDWCLYNKRKDTETHREDRHVAVETEIRVIRSECQGKPTATRRQEEASFSRNFRGNVALPSTQSWTFRLRNYKRINFCYFKLPSLC